MTITVESLEKLERKMIFTVPAGLIQSEITRRLKKLAQTVKMRGFRPGKVPVSFLERNHGESVRREVLGDQVSLAFAHAVAQAQLQIVGNPKIHETNSSINSSISDSSDAYLFFEAIFEVMPDITIGDLSSVEIKKVTTTVTDAAIDKTLEILRQQNCTFLQRPLDAVAQDGDRITADYEGKIDGEPFPDGKAVDFHFILGDGQMLQAFEDAARGMKTGESKTFQVSFPADYRYADIAGKSADFMLTINQIETVHLPDVTPDWVQSLGINEVSIDGLRENIRKSVQREVDIRLLERHKMAVMNALFSISEFDLPKASIQEEMNRLLEQVRFDLQQRGVQNADKLTIKEDVLRPRAAQNVRWRLVLSEMIRSNGLQAQPEHIRAYVEGLASIYEQPDELVQLHLSDKNKVEQAANAVLEQNVIDYVFSKAQVSDQEILFDELMK